MDYAEAIAWLEGLQGAAWKLDLTRIARLCALANQPQQAFPAALVGGSAGKGSTCAFLASICRAAGLRTGLAPKPHLFSWRERVQVSGEPIPEAQFAALMARARELALQVREELGLPTVFEVMTLLAFLAFRESAVERAVVEVGLGGRLDSTNVLAPDLSIITTIGLDHVEQLGDTVEKIAAEKAGILRAEGRAVTGATGGGLAVIERAAAACGCPLRRLGREIVYDVQTVSSHGSRFHLRTPELNLQDLTVGMTGRHQLHNAALAAAGALWLSDRHPQITATAVREGLRTAACPGRLQVAGMGPTVLVDAAHSPDRALALREALQALYLTPRPTGPVVLVMGCSEGHAPREVVSVLAPLAERFIATRSRHPRAVPAEQIASAALDSGVSSVETVEPVAAALAQARSAAGASGIVVVTGSLFVVAEALA